MTSTDVRHTAKAFLDAGYPVRGTVRSKEKGEYLANLFKDSKVPFEYVIVEDIAKVSTTVQWNSWTTSSEADASLALSMKLSRALMRLLTPPLPST